MDVCTQYPKVHPTVDTNYQIPQTVLDRTTKPVFRVKNIHPELTEEDLTSLFSKVAPVDFIQFDDNKKSVAYGSFEDDNKELVSEAIQSFSGKKAMGKILIVEDPTAPKPSLKDRLGPIPGRNGPHSRGDRGRGRGGNRGGRSRDRYKERDSYRPQRPKKVAKSVEDLDKELSEYMNSS